MILSSLMTGRFLQVLPHRGSAVDWHTNGRNPQPELQERLECRDAGMCLRPPDVLLSVFSPLRRGLVP